MSESVVSLRDYARDLPVTWWQLRQQTDTVRVKYPTPADATERENARLSASEGTAEVGPLQDDRELLQAKGMINEQRTQSPGRPDQDLE